MSIAILCISMLFCGGFRASMAQDLPPMTQGAWHLDSVSGKVYWNRHAPVFLSISPHADGTGGLTLKSRTMERYSHPFYFDTEGPNYLRTRWAVDPDTRKTIQPQREVLWDVYADSQAPRSRERTLGAVRTPSGQLALGPNSHIELQTQDALSGVALTYYSLNGGAYRRYEGEIQPSEQGANTLRFFSDDRVGNRESVRTVNFLFDVQPPRSQCHVAGIHLADNTIAQTSKVSFRAEDDHSGVASMQYRVDSGAWRPYRPGAAVPLQGIADGRHVFQFFARDHVGNAEAVQEFGFFMDNTAPITISDVLGDKFFVDGKTFFSGRTKMKITAVDNHSGVKEVLYSIDGEPFKPYSEPFYMPSTPGWHVVKYYSIDSMENRMEDRNADRYYEYRMKVDKIYVDLTGPKISHKLDGERFIRNDTVFVSPSTRVTLRGVDMESGLKRMAYAINGDRWEKSYDAPFDLQGLASGEHRIEYFGYDNVENRNIADFKIILDNDAPEVQYHLSVVPYDGEASEDGQPVYPLDAQVYLSAQDNMTGIRSLRYSLNGKPMVEYSKSIRGLERGRNRLLIRVTDMVGNTHESMHQFNVR